MFLFWLAGRSRANLPIPRWVASVAILSSRLAAAMIGTYKYWIKKFWEAIRGDWLAHERALSEDLQTDLAD